MPVLSTRIVLDCFYLLIFYSEKFSIDVCRLPYTVNVNLNLSIIRKRLLKSEFTLMLSNHRQLNSKTVSTFRK